MKSISDLYNLAKEALKAIANGESHKFALITTTFLSHSGTIGDQSEGVTIAFADMLSKNNDRIQKSKAFWKTIVFFLGPRFKILNALWFIVTFSSMCTLFYRKYDPSHGLVSSGCITLILAYSTFYYNLYCRYMDYLRVYLKRSRVQESLLLLVPLGVLSLMAWMLY